MTCIVILLVCLIVVLSLNHAYKRTNAYFNQYYPHWDFNQKNVEKIIILGSTYSRYAFEGFKYLRINHTNFTLNSQSVEDTYKNLKNVKSKLNKNIVILSLAPCTLMYEGEGMFRMPGTTKANLKQKVKFAFPILNPKRLLKLISDESRYCDIYDARTQVNSQNEAEKQMKALVDIWKQSFALDDLMNDNLPAKVLKTIKKNIEWLSRIIDICEKHECKLVIIIPPFSDLLNKHMSKDFVDKALLSPLDGMISQHKNIHVFDYRRNEDFQSINDYLDGGFILNRNGSQKFIDRVNESLNLNLSNRKFGLDY